jgi:hypothetical protein
MTGGEYDYVCNSVTWSTCAQTSCNEGNGDGVTICGAATCNCETWYR